MNNSFFKCVAAMALWGWLGVSAASIVINGTRVIVNEVATETTVQLRNAGDNPVLMQAWVDDGDSAATPDRASSPFVLMPPVARIDPEKGQAIRMLRTADVPNKQQETLFWLNVVEIPPKPTESLAAGDNLLLFSFRSRLKVFYRPAALAKGVDQAHKQLCFSYDAASKKMRVRNPTPFHITFRALVLSLPDGTAVGELVSGQNRMVAPESDGAFALRLAGVPSLDMTVQYSVINDFGGDTLGQRKSAASCS